MLRFERFGDYLEPVFGELADSGDPTVYVASGHGFCDPERLWYNTVLLPLLVEVGLTVLDPWSLTDPAEIAAVVALPPGDDKTAASRALNHRIAERNYRALRHACCMVASLEGASVDDGTASEIGFLQGMNAAHNNHLPIFGYRTDWRQTGEAGSLVSLQVEYWITESGGQIVTSIDALRDVLVEFVRNFHDMIAMSRLR